nr:hypothetical protein [Angustibacter aerolatus]
MTDPAEQPPEPTRDRLVADAVRGWQAVGTDPLLRFRDLPSGTLDLTHAHPSGLAMLFAGRPTRLSGLVREPGSLADARRRARAVRARTLEPVGAPRHRRRLAGRRHRHLGRRRRPRVRGARAAAPVRAAAARQCGEDYDVDLAGAAVLNPALVRHLADDHGIELDADAVAALAVTDEGFDPAPVLAHVERTCQGLPGLRVEHRLVIGTFADVVAPVVHDLQRLGPRLAAHDVVAALAGDASAREALQRPAPEPAGDRDPASEHLVLDLDASQQDVVEAVLAGGHRVVEAPAGTGGTQPGGGARGRARGRRAAHARRRGAAGGPRPRAAAAERHRARRRRARPARRCRGAPPRRPRPRRLDRGGAPGAPAGGGRRARAGWCRAAPRSPGTCARCTTVARRGGQRLRRPGRARRPHRTPARTALAGAGAWQAAAGARQGRASRR